MPRLAFRTKLLFAMVFIVASVSVATLLVTQARVQRNYERMFRDQFEQQVGFFTALQDARLGAVKEQCLKLSRSVRLIAAMSEPEVDVADLYQIAQGELREVADDGRDEPAGEGRRTRAAFFRFLDPTGKPLVPHAAASDQPLRNPTGALRGVLASGDEQQAGYIVEVGDGGETGRLLEVVVTRVTDIGRGSVLGALVIGFVAPDSGGLALDGEAAAIPGSTIRTGILLKGRLFVGTNSFSATTAAEVARQTGLRTADGSGNKADFSCRLDGVEHRVFCGLINPGSPFAPAYRVCLFPLTEARREQANLRWKLVLTGVAAMVAGLALSLLLSHGLSAPLRDLVAGTGEIRRGNFQVRVEVRSRDEMGDLARSFNEMAGDLALKEKYRNVLNMVADEKVAHRLLDGEITLGGEVRQMSVLFCDIRGFTSLTQGMPPGEVIEMLNEHMTALTRVVKEHHGIVDKFVGDLLMAVFGAPIEHGNDALNAARCASEMVRVRRELDETARHRIEIGTGVATGTMVVGCMGSTERLNYTVLGERVNLASRLCSQARAGEVLVDEETMKRVQDWVRCDAVGEIQLKGFSAPVRAYRLRTKQGEPA